MRIEYVGTKPDDYPFNEGIEETGKYIFDDTGFFIDEAGEILDLYRDRDGKVFSVINLEQVFINSLVPDFKPEDTYRRVRYMKKAKMWRAEHPKTKCTNLYDTADEAALRANELAEDSDWLPNRVPWNLHFIEPEWVKNGIKVAYEELTGQIVDRYTNDFRLFLALSHDSTFFILDTEENATYIEKHLSAFKGRISAVHMDQKPKHIIGTRHVEVTIPKDVPYKTVAEYESFASVGLRQLCDVQGG